MLMKIKNEVTIFRFLLILSVLCCEGQRSGQWMSCLWSSLHFYLDNRCLKAILYNVGARGRRQRGGGGTELLELELPVLRRRSSSPIVSRTEQEIENSSRWFYFRCLLLSWFCSVGFSLRIRVAARNSSSNTLRGKQTELRCRSVNWRGHSSFWFVSVKQVKTTVWLVAHLQCLRCSLSAYVCVFLSFVECPPSEADWFPASIIRFLLSRRADNSNKKREI